MFEFLDHMYNFVYEKIEIVAMYNVLKTGKYAHIVKSIFQIY